MKKLHVKIDGEWKMVFCYMFQSNEIITTDNVKKALPEKQVYAEDDLLFFRNKFGNNEFELIDV